MSRYVRPILLLLLLSARLTAQPAPAEVTLDEATRERLGLELVTLEARTLDPVVEAPARVLDPAPLAEIDAALAELGATLAIERAEAERTERLFADDANVSQRARDEAAARLAGDVARDTALRRRLALEWGRGIASLDDAARARRLAAAARGELALVRVELSAGAAESPTRTDLAPAADPGRVHQGRVLGPLPAVDPQFQTPGLLVEARISPGELAVGQALVAKLPARGDAASGVVLPRSALVRRDGAMWAFVAADGGRFERRRAVDPQPVADGFFVASGFAAGDRVVVAGAADLLAAERAPRVEPRPAAATGDDDD